MLYGSASPPKAIRAVKDRAIAPFSLAARLSSDNLPYPTPRRRQSLTVDAKCSIYSPDILRLCCTALPPCRRARLYISTARTTPISYWL